MNLEQEGRCCASREATIIDAFLDVPCEDSFAAVFTTFSPQLLAFFRGRTGDAALAEDLTQDVLFNTYRRASQIRDRTLFRSWLFTLARNALSRHYAHPSRSMKIEDIAELQDSFLAQGCPSAYHGGFEFQHWMVYLKPREREVMILRFVGDWEYHEISAAKSIPLGTVQWIVFNSKKKLKALLAPHRSKSGPNGGVCQQRFEHPPMISK